MRRLIPIHASVVSASQFALAWRRTNWTQALVPVLEDIASVLAKCEGDEEPHKDSLQAANRTAQWLTQANSGVPGQLQCLIPNGKQAISTVSPSFVIPGESDNEVIESSLRILAFVQAIAALVEQSADDAAREAVPTTQHAALDILRDVAVQALVEYGIVMVHGRAAATIHGLLATDVEVSAAAQLPRGGVTTSVEVSRTLLHATVAVLRVLQQERQLQANERYLSRLRVLLRPSLLCASELSVAELCDIGFGLSCTGDAPLSTSTETTDGFASSGASYEDHNDWVAFGGELVKRLRRQVTPSVMASKEFSKSSKFSFSLRERKERERLEQTKKDMESENHIDLFTVSELASLSTSLGMSQFRDASFAAPHAPSALPSDASPISSGQLWDWIAQATCKLVEAEVSAADEDPTTDCLGVSFSRQDIRSICFACDYAGQPTAYDRIMRMLVDNNVVGEYIPAPSSARAAAFLKNGEAVQ
jgi:hypothetical protein